MEEIKGEEAEFLLSIEYGKEHMRGRKYKSALEYFQKALRFRPESASPNYLVGKATMKCGENLESLSHFLTAWRNEETTEKKKKILKYIRIAFIEIKDFEGGIKQLKSMLEESGEEEGKLIRAEIKTLLEEESNSNKKRKESSRELFEKGWNLEKTKSFRKAIEFYNASILEFPQNESLLHRAHCYSCLREYNFAIKDFHKYLKETPTSDPRTRISLMLRIGECEFYQQKYEAALATLRCAKDIAEYFMIEDSEAEDYWKLATKFVNKISSLHPLSTIPSKEEVKKEFDFVLNIMQNLDKYRILGSTWFAVSMRWYKVWLRYAEQNVEELPPPIYNEDIIDLEPLLLDNSDSDYIHLRGGLAENVDFLMIPEEMWDYLEKKYGGVGIKRIAFEEKGNILYLLLSGIF